jgi:hydroxymethylbilane synthase
MAHLLIGSRGSKLALWQANWVKAELERRHAGLQVEIEIIKTTGDRFAAASLTQIGGKGVFTKEIEDALLEKRVQLAVHSLKDLPTVLPAGLHLAAITEREDPRDALVVSPRLATTVRSLKELPEGARVGTSSLRRASQLRNLRPDLVLLELRGNVETRLRKLDEGAFDAIILASAGLLRLGLGERITEKIDPAVMIPAVGQGALALETSSDDNYANEAVRVLEHNPTRRAVEAERALLRGLAGGCAVPIAAFARIEKENSLTLNALVAGVDGRRVIRESISGPIAESENLGRTLAARLISAGAAELLPRLGQTSNGPLARRRCLVTRAIHQGDNLTRLLEEQGAQVISLPLIEIKEPESFEALDSAIQHLDDYGLLVFTSANGVEAFFRRFDLLGRDRRKLSSLRICAVGRKTAELLRELGAGVDVTPDNATGEALAAAIAGSGDLRQKRALMPVSQIARSEVPESLAKAGLTVDVVEAYRTAAPALSAEDVKSFLMEAKPDYILFTSPSTVNNLLGFVSASALTELMPELRNACIGPVTAAAIRNRGLTVDVEAGDHSAEGMIKALIEDTLHRGP